MVGVANGGEGMGDDHGGAALHELAQGFQDDPLAGGVQVAGGLVQQQIIRVVHDRPGDGDKLPLSAGEVCAARCHMGVEPVRQQGDEIVDPGLFGDLDQLVVGDGPFAAVADVLPDRSLHQGAPLSHQAERLAPGVQVVFLGVGVAEPDHAGLGIVQPVQELEQRALAGTVGPHHGRDLVLGDHTADLLQHQPLPVGKVHIEERDVLIGLVHGLPLPDLLVAQLQRSDDASESAIGLPDSTHAVDDIGGVGSDGPRDLIERDHHAHLDDAGGHQLPAHDEGDRQGQDAIRRLQAVVEEVDEPGLQLHLVLLFKAGPAVFDLLLLGVGRFDQGQALGAFREICGGSGEHGLGFLSDQKSQLRISPAHQNADGDQNQGRRGEGGVDPVHADQIDADAHRQPQHPHDGHQELAGKVAVHGDAADQGLTAVHIIVALADEHDLAPQLGPNTQVDLFGRISREQEIHGAEDGDGQIAERESQQSVGRHVPARVHHIAGEVGDVHGCVGGPQGRHEHQDEIDPGDLYAAMHLDIFPDGSVFRTIGILVLFHCTNTSW